MGIDGNTKREIDAGHDRRAGRKPLLVRWHRLVVHMSHGGIAKRRKHSTQRDEEPLSGPPNERSTSSSITTDGRHVAVGLATGVIYVLRIDPAKKPG